MTEFDRSEPVTVAVRIHSGAVGVHAEDRQSVFAEVVPLDGSEASRRAADETVVSLDGDTLVVRSPEQRGWSLRRSGRVGVTVRVPRGSSIDARSASGSFDGTGRFADVRVDLASGDARLEEAAGNVSVETASGGVTVVRTGGDLRAKSMSGDLRLGDVTGDVSADTASGDIEIGAVGGSVRADTASGDIEVGVLHRGRAQVKSASGDIAVGVAAGTGVWMDVITLSGKTRSDLTLGGDVPATGATLELRLRTASGDIDIRRIVVDTAATAA